MFRMKDMAAGHWSFADLAGESPYRNIGAAGEVLLHFAAAVLARGHAARQVLGDEVPELLVAHLAARVAHDAEVLQRQTAKRQQVVSRSSERSHGPWPRRRRLA